MKKIAILLTALMVISVGFLSGCNEQTEYISNDTKNETEEEPISYMTQEEIYEEFNNTITDTHSRLGKILNELLSSQITYEIIATWGNEIVEFCSNYALQTLPNLSISSEYEGAREEFNTTLQYFAWMGLDYVYYGVYEDADYGWDAVEHQGTAYEHWANCKEILGYG